MIEIRNLDVQAGEFRLQRANLLIPTGCYGVLMGRTGCGKTTILETVAGLKQATGGKIFLGERDVTQRKPADRDVGYVPQDGALFHTMTVAKQIGFALTLRGRSRTTIERRVEELAQMLEIEHLLGRKPLGLSGGERQRVALARALSFWPSCMLLDEPLSAVDEETRQTVMNLLKRIQTTTKVTCLHVTHNPSEAEFLGDIVYRINDLGQLEQVSGGDDVRSTNSTPAANSGQSPTGDHELSESPPTD